LKLVFPYLVVNLRSMREKDEEIRNRLPRLVMSLIMGIIFWMLSVFIPPTLSEVIIPGIETQASFLVWMLMILIMGIFLIRVLSDALILGDILTDVFVGKLGIKEERSPKRAAREFVYIIVIVLVVTAISPILITVENYGFYFNAILIYVGLGLVIVFIYDIGRILYTILENKAEAIADQLTKTSQNKKKRD